LALTRSDVPDLLLPGLKAEFALAYKSEIDNSVSEKIATIVNTTQPVQKYAWLGTVPPLREFLDERRPSGLASHAVSIEDRVFESTLAVDRKAIEDDQLDLIRLRIRDLAYRVAQHRHQLLVETLTSGFTELAYDGVSFFNTAHPTQTGSTYSNRGTSALEESSLSAAISGMMTVPDDQGTPLGILPDTLVVGPKLQWTALELVESPVVVYKGNDDHTAGATAYKNVFHGKLNVVVSPFLTGTADDYWFLLDTKRPIKALILQQRSDVPVEFNALEATSGAESAFMRDRYYYGVRARYAAGLGLPQTAFGAIL
jgi:phage major head subunit gpT-like protein